MSVSYTFEEIEAVLPAIASETDEPPPPGGEDAPAPFQMPVTIKIGERHHTLFKLLRSQKARGISLDGALAACHVENERAEKPLDRDELDAYLRRAWQQADQPGFGANAIQEVDPNELTRPAPTAPYEFARAFGPEHFVTRYIEFFSAQCDASLEFFEATALVALSLATHAMSVRLSGSAEPLRTNLYMLLVGDAAASRKTTTKNFLIKVARALAHLCGVLPEMASHEGTVSALAELPNHSAVWAVDEMAPQLQKLTHAQHLAGMVGLILELYSKTSYLYKRVSKKHKNKEGELELVRDDMIVTDVTFSILGCCTPTIFSKLTADAVESGLLPRFAIVWPTTKPERKARFQLQASQQEPTKLIQWLSDIAKQVEGSTVRFNDGVLDLLDREIDLPIEQDGDHGLMLKRIGVMAQKVAMLSAAGRLGRDLSHVLKHEKQVITVTADDARSAITVVRRWIEYSKAFEVRLNETAFEKNLKRCLEIVRGREGHVNRREIARRVHVPAKELGEIERTLVQREQIEVASKKGKTGQVAFFWKWVR